MTVTTMTAPRLCGMAVFLRVLVLVLVACLDPVQAATTKTISWIVPGGASLPDETAKVGDTFVFNFISR